MIQKSKVLGARGFFLILLALLALTDLAIFLNIPFLRQLLGLFFFTTVPGLLIILVLRLNKLGLTEKLVLSVGLSIVFSLLAGLLINTLYPLFGYSKPLSTVSVVTSFSVIILGLIIIAYLINRATFAIDLSRYKLSTIDKASLLLPVLFPLLSVLGMRLINTTGNNVVTIALLILIPVYVVWLVIMRKKISDGIYPVAIFLISISVVLVVALRSNYVIGRDTNWEYYFFQLILHNEHWKVYQGNILDACLSISLLPTVYQSFLNIGPDYLFKTLYPIILSVLPLVVFIIARKYLGTLYAFLASFFFISQFNFLWTASLARINLAVFFVLLACMVLFHDGIIGVGKKLFFILFTVSCILSHYSTAYIFFFTLFFIWLGTEILSRIVPKKRKTTHSSENHAQGKDLSQNEANILPLKKVITITMVMFFLVVLFFWYSQATTVGFNTGVSFIKQAILSLNLKQLFVEELREPLETQAFGQGFGYLGISAWFKFVFSWLTIALTGFGIIFTLTRFKRMVSNIGSIDKPEFLKTKIDVEYIILSIGGSAILVLTLVIPYIGTAYGISRLYFQMAGFFAVFLVIGSITVARFLKPMAYWLVLLVLIPFFLGNAGIVNQVFGPHTFILNSDNINYTDDYIYDQDSYAAKWLRSNGEMEGTEIYADGLGSDWLISQAGVFPWCDRCSLFEEDASINGYIYLRYPNVVNGKLFGPGGELFNLTQIQDKFIGKSRIYTNGGSEIYK